ncbi:MAG: hypothetical protein J4O14_02995 [Chloroflexi bacterium]|nr:hypothetical protein [Chloroflexota bacterium]MCI0783769.1 hypothetical protein [Chloroflexota bacterium]MCI0813450.1 hypothetical protein [Chloroflexota bacterium]MCI0817217.1 hypothetical protein [Chloroflexota bacterium]MCI0820508.1 hypothetical protein [Chloroflexota bacterium]
MAQGSIDDNSLTMLLLRVWMLAVPIAMLAAAVIFGGIAAADGRWALAGAMFGLGLLAIGLMAVHYWLLYRFGRGPTS